MYLALTLARRDQIRSERLNGFIKRSRHINDSCIGTAVSFATQHNRLSHASI
jgi:hypothetical protein